MSEVTFHLPIAGYESLARIIPGYLHAGADAKPVSVSAVADLIAMKGPNISANNRFFLSTGILERAGRAYKLTTDGTELARVLDYHGEYTGEGTAPDPVRSAWQTIVERNDFLNSVTTAVRVRGNMESEAFARHIALTSGAPNKPRFLTGARTVIAILEAAGRLVEDDKGVLRVLETEPRDSRTVVEPSTGVLQHEPTPSSHGLQTDIPSSRISFTAMVQITPTTTDDELAELAQKIRRLAHLISTNEEKNESDAEIS
jgi:hypothetical protein